MGMICLRTFSYKFLSCPFWPSLSILRHTVPTVLIKVVVIKGEGFRYRGGKLSPVGTTTVNSQVLADVRGYALLKVFDGTSVLRITTSPMESSRLHLWR